MYRLHWSGELPLARTIWATPLIAGIPLLVSIAVFELLSCTGLDFDRLISQLGNLTALSTYASVAWWTVGTYRKSLQLMHDRLVAALVTYLLSIGQATLLISLIVLRYVNINEEPVTANRDVVHCAPREKREADLPWTVMAIPELNQIVASGTIGTGSAKALEKVIAENPNLHLLSLESLGGYVREKEMIIELVRKHTLDTLVLSKCASACTGIFLAGGRRFVTPETRFGFHRSGYCGMPRNAPWATPEYMTSIHYREQGVAENFIAKALDAPFESLWVADSLELLRGGFATNWWFDRPPEYRRGVGQLPSPATMKKSQS